MQHASKQARESEGDRERDATRERERDATCASNKGRGGRER